MQSAAQVPDGRIPILLTAAAFFAAVAFGAGLITMAAVDNGTAAGAAPAPKAPAAAVRPSGTVVHGTVDDFSIHLDRVSVPAGKMSFEVTNLGPSFHEFVILRTDHAANHLPMIMEEGYMRAAEDSNGDANVDELGGIKVGHTRTLTTSLKAGHYVIICNLPHHYMSGMRIGLDVTS